MNMDRDLSERPSAQKGGEILLIRPRRGWIPIDLAEFWRSRSTLSLLVMREIKGRYRQMALGPLWIVITPLMQMVVFTIIFGKLAKIPSDGIPYPLFSYAALVPWHFFSKASTKAATSLVSNLYLISKVYFSRLVIPASAVLVSFIEFLFSFVILVAMAAAYGYWPTINYLAIPLFLLLAAMTAMTVGLWLSGIAVKYRDVSFVVGYALQFWMYLSPVVYPTSLVPEQWRLLYYANPMVTVVDGMRWALIGGDWNLDMRGVLLSVGVVLVLFVLGSYQFRYQERNIVDLK